MYKDNHILELLLFTSTLNRKTENQYPDGNRGALLAALFREADPREEVRRQLEGSYGISMLL